MFAVEEQAGFRRLDREKKLFRSNKWQRCNFLGFFDGFLRSCSGFKGGKRGQLTSTFRLISGSGAGEVGGVGLVLDWGPEGLRLLGRVRRSFERSRVGLKATYWK